MLVWKCIQNFKFFDKIVHVMSDRVEVHDSKTAPRFIKYNLMHVMHQQHLSWWSCGLACCCSLSMLPKFVR